ncbi:MAG: hypothetical protein GF344_18105 [Chitinivibrionales bacterium]|nr:hypothetical protein [Chitinivibrionales bacterium]MBD3358571.1 hypothetical protein [Chitinivibrionales bacterium]
MNIPGTVPKHVESIPWQDYRASETGLIAYYNSDPVSELAIREIPEQYPSEVAPDPNYETGTYGLYGCGRNKVRNTLVKAKSRYLFFMTRYEGTIGENYDRVLVTGYYRVAAVADVQKLHIRYLEEYSCIGSEKCMALRADEAAFVSVEDAYEVSSDVLKSWGAATRVTKQTRIALDEEQTKQVLEHLKSKPNRIDDYIEQTKQLSPANQEDEEEEEEI